MKFKISHALAVAVSLLLVTPARGEAGPQIAKPVKGTWLNLVWQDERNNYMNPPGSDNTDPALWRLKVAELSEMGMEYLVIMAVANERRAFYPSDFMPPAYPAGRESPVEAIMNAADFHGMKVFMSCGWAVSQDDNLRDPEIRAIQLRIMEETGRRFSRHDSFYGWYLPVEDSMEPVLSEHAVDAVNTLTAHARRVTPGKPVMISPYGLCYADVGNPLFAERIGRLQVDIIAYQDEVGCVREPMPMPRMKQHFEQLGRIHRENGIAFWANVESFTWDRDTNSRVSALVPAPFPRYLSQMTGVTLAGAEEVISFSVFGIFDKPGSAMPLGQPVLSNAAYDDYADWKAGRGRWPFLEATFAGRVDNGAGGAAVAFAVPPHPVRSSGGLTDGCLGKENSADRQWLSFAETDMEAVIDLGRVTEINTLAARFLHYRIDSVSLPGKVGFYLSTDGKSFDKATEIVMEHNPNDLHDCWIDAAYALVEVPVRARYVKVIATRLPGTRIMCDEVFVNPVIQ